MDLHVLNLGTLVPEGPCPGTPITHRQLCAHSNYMYYIEYIIRRFQNFTFHYVFDF